MTLILIFCCVFVLQLYKTDSPQRKVLVLCALLLYLIISFYDLLYLGYVYDMAFHFSDPGAYYLETKDISFKQIQEIANTNIFYPILNWVYNHIYPNPYFVSTIFKIANIFVFLSTYLLLTKKTKRIRLADFVILFNPFLLLTIIRNVRDLYILFFIVVILLGFGCLSNNRLSRFWTILGLIGLMLIRPVLLLPVGCVWWYKNHNIFSKKLQWTVYILSICLIIAYSSSIIRLLGNQMISALDYIGEDIEPFLPLMNGQISPSIIVMGIKRISLGFISFIFTPHPTNYYMAWQTSMDAAGTYSIYTGLDNILIVLGACANYLFVYPAFIACIEKYKSLNRFILLYIIMYSIIYVTMYIGVTDIRNRYPVIFFMLFMYITSCPQIKIRPIHYGITLCIAIGIALLNAQ